MAETRRKFDQDFKAGTVRLDRETGRPIACTNRFANHMHVSGVPEHLADQAKATTSVASVSR